MHGPPHAHDDAASRCREGQRITLVGAGVSLGLAVLQLAAGWLGRSQAMVADGIHSLSDLLTDIAVWVGLRFSSTPPDAGHPWGHGKIETVVSVLVGATLALVGFGIGSEAVLRLREGTSNVPTLFPLVAAAVAIVSKEAIYRWTARVARRIHSQALVANAWHHRSDALSSIAALIGVAGARLGLPWMDPVAAAVVCLFILRIGVQVMWRGIQDLTERRVDLETLARMQEILEDDPAVIDAHRLRLRNVGGGIVGDVHITTDGNLTVRDSHDIVKRLQERTHAEISNLDDLVIHVDPEQDPTPREEIP